MEAGGGGMMGMGIGMYVMGMGARGSESEVLKATQALAKVLKDKDAAPGDIKSALQNLRDARAKAKAALEEAQKELRSVLTLRQEALLVQMVRLDGPAPIAGSPWRERAAPGGSPTAMNRVWGPHPARPRCRAERHEPVEGERR